MHSTLDIVSGLMWFCLLEVCQESLILQNIFQADINCSMFAVDTKAVNLCINERILILIEEKECFTL